MEAVSDENYNSLALVVVGGRFAVLQRRQKQKLESAEDLDAATRCRVTAQLGQAGLDI